MVGVNQEVFYHIEDSVIVRVKVQVQYDDQFEVGAMSVSVDDVESY